MSHVMFPLLSEEQVTEFGRKADSLKSLAAKHPEATSATCQAIKMVLEFYESTEMMVFEESSPERCAELAEDLAIVAKLEHLIIMNLVVLGPHKPTIEKQTSKWI